MVKPMLGTENNGETYTYKRRELSLRRGDSESPITKEKEHIGRNMKERRASGRLGFKISHSRKKEVETVVRSEMRVSRNFCIFWTL